MGVTRGGLLPAGLTLFGRAWSEPMLFKLAYAYEQATRHRRPPVFDAAAAVVSRAYFPLRSVAGSTSSEPTTHVASVATETTPSDRSGG